MRKFTLLLCAISAITWGGTIPVHAGEPEAPPSRPIFEAVSPLSKGDKAPFEGILLSKDLAARIEAERKTMISLRLAKARTDAEVKIATSKLQLKLDLSQGKLEALEDKHEKIVQINREQIDFLRKNYMPKSWYEEPAFLVTVGVVLGVGLAIGAAHLVKTVN